MGDQASWNVGDWVQNWKLFLKIKKMSSDWWFLLAHVTLGIAVDTLN